MRLAQVGLVLALALAATGCGGEERSATAGAEIVSANAPAFVAIDSDLSSEQWQAFDDLLRSFPGRSQLLDFLRSTLREDTGLEYERDVKPALGEELDLVWLDFEADGENVVGLTKPKDETAFRRLIEKGNASDDSGDDLLLVEVEGWTVVSDSQGKLDRFREQARSGDKLADDVLFDDAMAELPDEALVKAYARGESLLQVLENLAQIPGAGSVFQLQPQQRPEFIAAALAAEDEGIRLVGAARTEQQPEARLEAFESKLIDDVPGDAVAFLTFRGGEAFDRQLEQLDESDAYREGLRQFEQMLGVPFNRLFSLFENEVAFYIRPGTPLPEFTLLLEAPNEEEALKDVEELINALTRVLIAQPCHEPTEQDGVKVNCTEFENVAIRRSAFDGKVVVTTGHAAIREIRSRGEKLPDDEGYKEARKAAGVPETTPGFVWLDFEDGLPLVLGLLEAADTEVPQVVRANLEPLTSLLVWVEVDGRTSSFELFLGID